MSETIIMPKLGMTMTEGTIVEWYKEVGDPVKRRRTGFNDQF